MESAIEQIKQLMKEIAAEKEAVFASVLPDLQNGIGLTQLELATINKLGQRYLALEIALNAMRSARNSQC